MSQMPVKTFFPDFVPNQILTNTQLNDLREYLDNQNRLTRVRLTGTGIVCGLHAICDETGANPVIRISEGFGITSDGYLIEIPAMELVAKAPYLDPDRVKYTLKNDPNDEDEIGLDVYGPNYDPWRLQKDEIDINLPSGLPDDPPNNPVTQMEITALFTQEEVDNHKDPDSLDFIDCQDHVLVLYLEIQKQGLKSCLTTDCNNKGQNLNFVVKPLLIHKDKLTPVEPCKDWLNPAFLPRFHRAVKQNGLAGLEAITQKDEINAAYEKIVLEVKDPLFKKIKDTYGNVNPFLHLNIDETALDVAWDKAIPVGVNAVNFNQYHYDFLKDVVCAYNEFTAHYCKIIDVCCPELDFPRHLMIRDFEDDPAPYRHEFSPSPVRNVMHNDLKKAEILFLRIVELIKNFDLTLTDGIKITPSQNDRHLLGEKAIPHYYELANSALKNVWQGEPCCRDPRLLSYSDNTMPADLDNVPIDNDNDFDVAEYLNTPLETLIDKHGFFRIEGHLGQNCLTTIDNISKLKKIYNLDFSTRLLFVGNNAPPALGIAPHCKPTFLQADYLTARQEMLCLLMKLNGLMAPKIKGGREEACVTFEGVKEETPWGITGGNEIGDLVHNENNISINVFAYINPAGAQQFESTFARKDFSNQENMVIEFRGASLFFDFSDLGKVNKVTFFFRNQGPEDNIVINESKLHIGHLHKDFNGEELAPGVIYTFEPDDPANPTFGTATLTSQEGIQNLLIGGVELQLDNICAHGSSDAIDNQLIEKRLKQLQNAVEKAMQAIPPNFESLNCKEFIELYKVVIQQIIFLKMAYQKAFEQMGHNINLVQFFPEWDDFLDCLAAVQFSCLHEQFCVLEAIKNALKIEPPIAFKEFAARYSGMEHLAGVERGNTFLLVCDTETGNVEADFTLNQSVCCCGYDFNPTDICVPPIAMPLYHVLTVGKSGSISAQIPGLSKYLQDGFQVDIPANSQENAILNYNKVTGLISYELKDFPIQAPFEFDLFKYEVGNKCGSDVGFIFVFFRMEIEDQAGDRIDDFIIPPTPRSVVFDRFLVYRTAIGKLKATPRFLNDSSIESANDFLEKVVLKTDNTSKELRTKYDEVALDLLTQYEKESTRVKKAGFEEALTIVTSSYLDVVVTNEKGGLLPETKQVLSDLADKMSELRIKPKTIANKWKANDLQNVGDSKSITAIQTIFK